MPSVQQEGESIYVSTLAAMINRADEVKRLKGLNDCCLDRSNDRYNLIRGAEY